MPELPEVETIRRGLEARAAGRTIKAIEGDNGRLFRNNEAGFSTVKRSLQDRTIRAIDRRGKFMWLRLDDSPAALVIHLGMSGQVRAETPGTVRPAKHEHLRLTLDDGSALSFVDPRTFGHLTVSELALQGGRQIPHVLSHIAPDVLEDTWSPEVPVQKISRSGRRIKTLLLDQGIISGIGNIYADEGLFRARLSGHLPGRSLSSQQATAVLLACGAAMSEAIHVGGTSFDSLYVDVEGNPGYFSRDLAVYGRGGQPCVNCHTPIVRTVVDGRSHFFCEACQKSYVGGTDTG